jgi:hypothetical protein
MITKEQIEQFLNSPIAGDVKTLIAFAIVKTPTTKDDEIASNISDYAGIIAENLTDLNSQPTDKEAKDAAIRIAKEVAKLTKTKWDDIAISLIDKVV